MHGPTLALVVLLVAALGCQSDQERAEELLADALLQMASPPQAVPLLEQAIALDPTLERAHRERARLHLDAGELDDAIEHATSALDVTETPEARAIRGQAELAREQWQAAVTDLARAREMDGTRRDLDLPLGLAHRALGEVEQAAEALGRALEAAPDDRNAALELAELQLTRLAALVAPEELSDEAREQGRTLLATLATVAPVAVVGPGEEAPTLSDGQWVLESGHDAEGSAAARWRAVRTGMSDARPRLAWRYAIQGPTVDEPPRPADRRAGILGLLNESAFLRALEASPEATEGLTGEFIGSEFDTDEFEFGLAERDGAGPREGTVGFGNIGTLGQGSARSSAGGPSNDARVRMGVVAVTGALTREVVHRLMRRNLLAFRQCYARRLTGAPHLAGTIDLRFTIAADGSAASVQATGVDDDVSSCVQTRVHQTQFPTAEGGPTTVTFPLHLTTR